VRHCSHFNQNSTCTSNLIQGPDAVQGSGLVVLIFEPILKKEALIAVSRAVARVLQSIKVAVT